MNDLGIVHVMIADDHPVVRAGIVSMLEKEPDIVIIAETGKGEQIEELVANTTPDVLVLDVNMPGFDPIEKTHQFTNKYPEMHILVLTAYDDDAYVTGLLSAGAMGYLLKEEALDTLVDATRAVAQGKSWLSQRIARKLAQKAITPGKESKSDVLTPREREILRLLALGLSNAQIGEKLFITKRTVQNHVSNIYRKTDLESRPEAILYAIRNGIVDIDEVKGS
jgi:DNA-binding NarL/FixJ family response regulator